MQSSFMRRAVTPFLALWFSAFAQLASAQAQAAEQEAEGKPAVSPVVMDGRVLFSVRGVTSLPSEQRAADIAERIAEIAKGQFDPQQLNVIEDKDAQFSAIHAGERRIAVVADADAKLEGVRREVLARIYKERIGKAVNDYRRERSSEYLLTCGLQALAASGLFLAVLYALALLTRRMQAFVERIARKHMAVLEEKTFSLVRAQQVWDLLSSTIVLFKWVILLAATNAYFSYSFSLFPWTRPFAEILLDTLIVPLRHMGHGFSEALPGVAFIFVLAIVLRYLLGLIKLFFAGVAEGSISWQGIESDWALPTYRLIRLLVIALGLVVAYPYIPGSNSEAFKGLSLMFGLLLSLGASSIVGNILAGYSLIYRRAFKVGDRIKVGEHMGEVTLIGALVTNLRTPKNEIVVVPNSEILSSSIVNYSTLKEKNGLILHTTVGIGYETPWRQVEAMLLEAADRTPGLLKQPGPFVLEKSLGDFCIVYEINAHTDAPEAMHRLYAALHQNILDIFNEYGIQIMTPAYEGDPAEPKVVPKDAWYAAPAQLPEKDPG